MKSSPKISIIICTCNRTADLRQTLAALSQVCVPEFIPTELVIVDNASADETAAVVQQCRLPNMPVRYVYEPQRGKGYAYNRGMAEARGHVLLFTDDDVRPPQNWIEGMCTPILSGQADAVAGGVKIAPHLEREWMQRDHRCWLACTDWLETPIAQSMVGANMAFSKKVLAKVPAFDPELGPGGLGFFDETLFSWQLKEAGFQIVSVLPVAVEHHFEENRLQRKNFLATAEKYGKSQAYLAYHWEHRTTKDSRLTLARRKMSLMKARMRNQSVYSASEGISYWEFERVSEISFLQHYLRLKHQPRNYAKRGLEKLHHG